MSSFWNSVLFVESTFAGFTKITWNFEFEFWIETWMKHEFYLSMKLWTHTKKWRGGKIQFKSMKFRNVEWVHTGHHKLFKTTNSVTLCRESLPRESARTWADGMMSGKTWLTDFVCWFPSQSKLDQISSPPTSVLSNISRMRSKQWNVSEVMFSNTTKR